MNDAPLRMRRSPVYFQRASLPVTSKLRRAGKVVVGPVARAPEVGPTGTGVTELTEIPGDAETPLPHPFTMRVDAAAMSEAASEREGLQRRLIAMLRDVPDFPKPGIVFKDITPVLADAALLRDLVAAMAAPWEDAGITHVAGVESRGFILAAPIAIELGAGFIPIRKPGKLPWKTSGKEYALEYGSDRLEIHVDACPAPARVLLVDDVLATGGTAAAACELIEQVEGTVLGCAFLLTITGLRGADRLSHRRVESLLEC